MKARSAVIILDPCAQQIVLIHRFRQGREYYTLPGGKIEPNETPEEAAIREVREETGLTVTLRKKICILENLGRTEHYFLAGNFSGQLELGGPEKNHQSPENRYQLEWIKLEHLDQVNLLPVEVKRMIEDAR